MQKLFSTFALGAASVFSANAQSDGRFSASIGLEGALPIGSLHDGFRYGIGGTAKGGVKVFDQDSITLTAGYIRFMGKNVDFGLGTVKIPSIGYIPVKAGFNYSFGSLYIEPEAGIGHFTGGSGGDGITGFAYTGLAGVKFNVLDISTRYEGVSKNGTNSFLWLRVALGF